MAYDRCNPAHAYRIQGLSIVPRFLADSDVWLFPNDNNAAYPLILGVYIPAHLADEVARLFPPPSHLVAAAPHRASHLHLVK